MESLSCKLLLCSLALTSMVCLFGPFFLFWPPAPKFTRLCFIIHTVFVPSWPRREADEWKHWCQTTASANRQEAWTPTHSSLIYLETKKGGGEREESDRYLRSSWTHQSALPSGIWLNSVWHVGRPVWITFVTVVLSCWYFWAPLFQSCTPSWDFVQRCLILNSNPQPSKQPSALFRETRRVRWNDRQDGWARAKEGNASICKDQVGFC